MPAGGRHRHRNLRPGRGGRGTLAALPFTDVPETMWYYDSVYYVYAHGLMNGTAATPV